MQERRHPFWLRTNNKLGFVLIKMIYFLITIKHSYTNKQFETKKTTQGVYFSFTDWKILQARRFYPEFTLRIFHTIH